MHISVSVRINWCKLYFVLTFFYLQRFFTFPTPHILTCLYMVFMVNKMTFTTNDFFRVYIINLYTGSISIFSFKKEHQNKKAKVRNENSVGIGPVSTNSLEWYDVHTQIFATLTEAATYTAINGERNVFEEKRISIMAWSTTELWQKTGNIIMKYDKMTRDLFSTQGK